MTASWIDRAIAIRTVDGDDVPTDGKFRTWKFEGATLTPDGDRLIVALPAGTALTPADPATLFGVPADNEGDAIPAPLTPTQARASLNVDDGATKETRVKRTVKAATAALTQGCAVVTDGSTVKLGTPALVRAAGRISGLAVAAASAGATATIHTAGPLDPAIFSLGAGVACAVGITSAGVPVRVTDAAHASKLDYVGFCDTTGTVTVAPRQADRYDISDYGAVDGGSVDCYDAVVAAIAAQGPANNPSVFVPAAWRGARVFVPPGKWRMSQALHVGRSLTIEGANGAGWYAISELAFDRGVIHGIVADYVLTSEDGGRADWGTLQDLAITYGGATSESGFFPQWEPSTPYTAGDEVCFRDVLANPFGYVLRCVVGGTSGTTDPVGPDDYWIDISAEDTVADGSVEWEVVRCDGVHVRAGGYRAKNLWVIGWPGNAVAIVGNLSPSSPDSEKCSTSLWRVDDVRGERNGGHGLFVFGNDANVGRAMGFDASFNRGQGMRVDGGATNYLEGCHAANNEGGDYWCHYATLVSCYSEGGNSPLVMLSAVWLGGTLGEIGAAGTSQLRGGFSGFWIETWTADGSTTAGDRIRPTSDNGYYYRAITTGTRGSSEPAWPKGLAQLSADAARYDIVDGSVTWRPEGYTVASSGILEPNEYASVSRTFRTTLSEELCEFTPASKTSAPVAFSWGRNTSQYADPSDYAVEWNGSAFAWFFKQSGLDGRRPIGLTGQNAPQGAGQLLLPNGVVVGNKGLSGTELRLFAGNAAPTGAPPEGGAWNRGDRCVNSDASVSSGASLLGWVCTVAGAPGTWIEMWCSTSPSGGGDVASLLGEDGTAGECDILPGYGAVEATDPSGGTHVYIGNNSDPAAEGINLYMRHPSFPTKRGFLVGQIKGDSYSLRLHGSNGLTLTSASTLIVQSTADTVVYIGASERYRANTTGQAWNGATPIAKPTITGSRASGAALADLLTQLAAMGLLSDGSSA